MKSRYLIPLVLLMLLIVFVFTSCGRSREEPTPTAPSQEVVAVPTDTSPPPTATPTEEPAATPTEEPATPTEEPAAPTEEPSDSEQPDDVGASAESALIAVDFTSPVETPPDAAHAVDLLMYWIEAGAPEVDSFMYTGYDGGEYPADYATDILPLFTEPNLWYPGAPSCNSCHHDNLENSYHEMDLGSHAGILAGADRLEEPPGVPLLGQSGIGESDFDWDASKVRARLRNNRMPPGMPFDITEANRDGPLIDVNGTEVPAVELLAAWVEAGAPEEEAFGEYEATFADNVQSLFSEAGVWYEDAPSCSSCHHGNLENSYHEMDLSSYEGILAGADRLEDPPGVPLLGQSAIGESDFDWENSKIRERLRNNRMPPGMPFDITEANRDGALVQVGYVEGTERGSAASTLDVELVVPDLDFVSGLITRGGCQACHVIPGIAGAVGVVGPSWCEPAEEFQQGEIDVAFLYNSITEPNAEVGEGFPANVMPPNFGEIYGEDELDTLIAFIATLKCDE